MGAWGIGIFENDDAMDWAVQFGHAPSAQSLRQAFEAVIGAEDYIERDLGGYALAAAEVVAAAKGMPCRDLPPALGDWAAANRSIATPALVPQAAAAVERVTIKGSSEVAELWAETKHAAGWAALIDDLKNRLRS